MKDKLLQLKQDKSKKLNSGLSSVTNKLLLGAFLATAPLIQKSDSKQENKWLPQEIIKKEVVNTYKINLLEQKMLKIQNINSIDDDSKKKLLKKIEDNEKKLDRLGVPENFRLPLDLVCFSHTDQINIITRFRNIHYIPSVDLLYTLSEVYYEKYKQYWDSCPSLPIVLWLFSQESWFRNIPWDTWLSRGIGQLHLITAKWLLRKDKDQDAEIFGKYFFINKNNRIVFRWATFQEKYANMIRCSIDLLVLKKWYDAWNELESLARYNWSIYNYNTYARRVVKKAINYSLFIAATKFDITDSETSKLEYVKKNILPLIISLLDDENPLKKDPNKFFEVHQDLILSTIKSTSSRVYSTWISKNSQLVSKEFPAPISLAKIFNASVEVPEISDGYPYILVNKKVSIAPYFNGDTWNAIAFHNSVIGDNQKRRIQLKYYVLDETWTKQTRFVSSQEDLISVRDSGYMVYPHTTTDRLYLRPNTNLYLYNSNLSPKDSNAFGIKTDDHVTPLYVDHSILKQQEQIAKKDK